MRIHKFPLSLLFLLPTCAQAQVGEVRNEFAVGFNGGYVLNQVSLQQPSVPMLWKPGMTVGITARYTCEKYFSMLCALQAEINYTQMGWKEEIEYVPKDGSAPDTYERNINYVQMPLLARLAFGKEQRGVMGYLILGPQVGFYLNDSDKRTGKWDEETLSQRPNHVVAQYDLPVHNKFDYGITAGLGIEFNTSIGHFLAEGRYYFALSDVFKNGKGEAFGRSSNSTIVAKVSYLFDVKK